MKNKKLMIILCAVAVLLIAALTVVIVLAVTSGNKNTADDSSPAAPAVLYPTAASPDEPTAVTTPDEASPTTPDGSAPSVPGATDALPTAAQVDEELAALLAKRGLSADSLKQSGASQLVTVASSGSSAAIDFWYIKDGKWVKDSAMSAKGYVGSMGVTDEMSEYITATPAGLFPVTEAFYIYDEPETGLSTFEITNDTYWVDDPDSAYYNKRVEGTDDQDWSSAEHMVDYPNYRYGFVIGYNLDCEKGKGSAIFFHIGSGSTAGCVATDEQAVLAYLAAMKKDLNPHILIL